MFVSFIAALIRYDNWEIIGEILINDLFVEKKYEGKYMSFVRISSYVASIDEIRNKRLHLNRISIMADTFRDRFTKSELSELITHKEFLEADYFLFMRTVCQEDDLEYLQNVWCPRSCVWLDRPPNYIVKAESKRFLEKIIKAIGFEKSEEFIENFKSSHSVFTRYFRTGWKDDPLEDFDFNKIGTRK